MYHLLPFNIDPFPEGIWKGMRESKQEVTQRRDGLMGWTDGLGQVHQNAG